MSKFPRWVVAVAVLAACESGPTSPETEGPGLDPLRLPDIEVIGEVDRGTGAAGSDENSGSEPIDGRECGATFDAENCEASGGGFTGSSCDYLVDTTCVRPLAPHEKRFVEAMVDSIRTNHRYEMTRITCENSKLAYSHALSMGRIGVAKYDDPNDNHDAQSVVEYYGLPTIWGELRYVVNKGHIDPNALADAMAGKITTRQFVGLLVHEGWHLANYPGHGPNEGIGGKGYTTYPYSLGPTCSP